MKNKVGQAAVSQDALLIYLLGDFSVWLGTLRIPEEAFERRKTRQLLKLLALQTEFRLHRDQVLDILWPELPPESASSQLHKAVHHIRRAFATATPTTSPEKLLEVKEGELRLWSPAGVTTDVNLFAALSKQALSSQTLSELERAAAEYRGDLLPSDLYEDWTTESRENLKDKATRIFKALGEAYLKNGDLAKAEEHFQLALSRDALQEDVHRSLFSLYALQGNKESLTQAFERYGRILRTELDEAPSSDMIAYYERCLRGLEPKTQTLTITPLAPSNLPPLTSPLIGRESELALLADNLAHPNCRLLSVVGTGGVGKTHLALETAHRSSFRDGVFFVPLVSVNLPNLMLTAIADALGLLLTGRKAIKEQLFDYLRDRELLLVLDNFEHLLPSSEVLLELCHHAPRLKFLTTTRERLQLKEEWVVTLEGLAYPQHHETKNLEVFPAVSLFLECARRVAPSSGVESQLEGVGRIARLVEGLPLALELAAAWVKLLQCSDIANELERNLDLLTTSLKNVPERHRSVQAVFEHSWQLLSEAERNLYARLSMFGSSFTLEAAKKIAGATLAQLSELHAKSLLNFSDGRYSSHHLLRQCATEKLQPQAKEAVRAQHAAYYSQQFFEQGVFLKGGQQKAVLQRVALELDNIRLAWNWAFDTGDIPTLERSLESLWLLVELRGWFQEGTEAFGRLLSFLALRVGDVPLLRAKAYARLGRCHFRLGQLSEAHSLLKQALERLGDTDTNERAFVLNNLGLVARDKAELEKAHDYFAEGLELYRRVEDSWGIANVLNNLGDVAFRLGHLAEAQTFYQESLELYRAHQDLRGTGLTLVNLGGVYEQQGNLKEAKRLFGSSLETARELADPYVQSRALTQLANLSLSTKHFAEAKDFYAQSLELALSMGNRSEAALIARQLGHIATNVRDFAEAETYLNQSLALFRKLADPVEIAKGVEALVGLHTLTNNQERVLELLSEGKMDTSSLLN